MLLIALFKYILVYKYSCTSKQKFPFMSEAKEGYLSTPMMSYSCMDIARLRHTKSLTKVVPSNEVAGFHITAPMSGCIMYSLLAEYSKNLSLILPLPFV